jgi:hypothetical protein
MGWRDELTGVVGANVEDDRLGGYYVDYPSIAADMLAMPPADRIALARELLAGTGKCVADVAALMPLVMSQKDREWQNRAQAERRAAMLGDEG